MKKISFKDCVSTHLSGLCRLVKSELKSDSSLIKLNEARRKVRDLSPSTSAISCRTSLCTRLDNDSFEKLEDMLDNCLGSLHDFEPAASWMPEYKRLKTLTSELNGLLNFARSLA